MTVVAAIGAVRHCRVPLRLRRHAVCVTREGATPVSLTSDAAPGLGEPRRKIRRSEAGDPVAQRNEFLDLEQHGDRGDHQQPDRAAQQDLDQRLAEVVHLELQQPVPGQQRGAGAGAPATVIFTSVISVRLVPIGPYRARSQISPAIAPTR